jgi:hypothetical protein
MNHKNSNNQFNALYKHLRDCDVPAQIAKKAADIVERESSTGRDRTPEEQADVTKAWAIAHKIDLSKLESFQGY